MADPLQAVIVEHSRFFDHLVDLIPARFYHGDGERLHLASMPKSARDAAKQQFKIAYKENKRAKLDPDAPAMTALAVQQAQTPAVPVLTMGNVSRDELREKLQRKIEAIQQHRTQKDKQAVAQQAKQWRDKTLQDNAKHKAQQLSRKADSQAHPSRRQDPESGNGGHRPAAKHEQSGKGQSGQGKGVGVAGRGTASGISAAAATAGEAAAEEDFQFARVQFPEARHAGKKHGSGRPMSKEALLAAAEAKAQERAQASGTTDGRVRVIQDAWKTALARAEGEKVLDDPKKLRKSLKKEAKRKEKSAKAWQERKQAQVEQQQRKQQKRLDNLAARTDRKIDKKRAAREKKLLRAGFEGRKEGFIGGGADKKAG